MGLKALHRIMNVVLASEDYLEGFRELKEMAVFKKGNAHDVNNFRPILITSFVATLTEKMYAFQMIKRATELGQLPSRRLSKR